MIHSLPKLCGSDGVETCCLVIKGRETHHSLARDFHAAAFALRLVVSAFTDREGDHSRRKSVAASDQNFARFVTPHHVRVNARSTETVARCGRHVCKRWDIQREQCGPASPRNTQCDQFWSSFPGMPSLQQYQRETDEQKHKPGSFRNRNIEAARADKSAAVALVQIQKLRFRKLRAGWDKTGPQNAT
jgi:hypothetical protein